MTTTPTVQDILLRMKTMAAPTAVRRLHIGGRQKRDTWEILDAIPGSHVDHVGDAADLSRFADYTFADVYASHVLEHFDYLKLIAVLSEWKRVLVPGGTIHISVPDLTTISAMLATPSNLTLDEEIHCMRMLFGGHVTMCDYHQTGLSERILALYLRDSGFTDISRVAHLGLFDDTSEMVVRGVAISLNVTARKMG